MCSKRIRFALVAVLAAVFAPGALTAMRPAASYYTPAALHALAARSAGMQAKAPSYPPASYYTPAALHALAARSAGMQGEPQYYTAATNPPRKSNRTSVIVGAGAAAIAAAALTYVLAVRLRRRRRASVPGAVHSES